MYTIYIAGERNKGDGMKEWGMMGYMHLHVEKRGGEVVIVGIYYSEGERSGHDGRHRPVRYEDTYTGRRGLDHCIREPTTLSPEWQEVWIRILL